MKFEDSPSTTVTLSNNPPLKQISPMSSRQMFSPGSLQRRHQFSMQQRRPNLHGTTSDFLNQHPSTTFSVPVLAGAMNDFFQSTKIMEDEIMLPSRLKDMPVDDIVSDGSLQINNWHELYTFVRDMRNQLARSHPFADHEKDHQQDEMKDLNDDEGILLGSHENTAHSSTSSIISSEELEQSSTSSTAPSFDAIRDELKFYYFGLLGSLDNLTQMASRVTERYREDLSLKNSK